MRARAEWNPLLVALLAVAAGLAVGVLSNQPFQGGFVSGLGSLIPYSFNVVIQPERLFSYLFLGAVFFGVAFALRRRAFILLLIFIGFIPWERSLLFTPSLSILHFWGGFMALCLFLGMLEKHYKVVWLTGERLLLVFLGMVLFANSFSSSISEELRLAFSYILLVGIVFVTVSLVDDVDKLKKVILVLVVSGTILAFHTLLLENAFTSLRVYRSIEEISGDVDSPGRVGLAAGLAAIFCLSFWGEASARQRVLIGVAVLLDLLAIFLAKSLAVVLGMGVGVLVIVFLSRRVGIGINPKKFILAPIIILAMVALWQTDAAQHNGVVRRMDEQWRRIKEEPFYRWGTSRGATWTASVQVIVKHPWFGVGEREAARLQAQNVKVILGYVLGSADQKGSHNSFLSVASGNGVPAAVLFFLVIVYAAAGLVKIVWAKQAAKLRAAGMWSIGLGFLASWGVMLVLLNAADFGHLKLVWLLLALSFSYTNIFHKCMNLKETEIAQPAEQSR